MTSATMTRHTHYRPYFRLRNGNGEKYGKWHHSQRKAWQEVAEIIHDPNVTWANGHDLETYGVGSYKVAGAKLDCQGDVETEAVVAAPMV